MATDSLGNAWISGKRYLSAYKVDAEGELKFSGNINNNIGSGVRDICYDNGDLWIIYQEHLAKYKIENDGSYTLAKQVMFHTPGGVLSLCVDPEYVWIGANEGLFQVWKSNESTSVMEHKHSPSNPYSTGTIIYGYPPGPQACLMPIQGPVFSKQSDTVLSERPIQVSVPNLSVPYITARMAMYIWEASLAD